MSLVSYLAEKSDIMPACDSAYMCFKMSLAVTPFIPKTLIKMIKSNHKLY